MANFELTKAIEATIQECKDTGKGKFIKTNEIWVEAEWVEYDDEHDIIEIFLCYTDTGRIAYSTYIIETLTKK